MSRSSLTLAAVMLALSSISSQPSHAEDGQNLLQYVPQSSSEEIVGELMSMAITTADADLEGMAGELAINLAYKSQLRADIADLEDTLAEWVDCEQRQFVSYHDENGVLVVSLMTCEDAENLLSNLMLQLEDASQSTQMMQLDLQDAMESYQRALQTLSGILKTQHVTTKAIIGGLR